MRKAASVPKDSTRHPEVRPGAKPPQAKTGHKTSPGILFGLALGVGTGLFFGERIAFLQWPARAFVELLQVTGLIQEQLDYWVHGKGAHSAGERRWSIAGNLLGW